MDIEETEENLKQSHYFIDQYDTVPYIDQQPSTSARLRKELRLFRKEHYLENYIQSLFDALGTELQKKIILIGGDGRLFSKEVTMTIANMCPPVGIRKVIIGKDCIVSTPAASCLVRRMGCYAAIILTACHKSGGENGYFGVKVNAKTGGPANQTLMDKVFAYTSTIARIKFSNLPLPSIINRVGIKDYKIDGAPIRLEICDSVSVYLDALKECFDFDMLKHFIERGFNIVVDCMNGVTGLYAKRIFIDELGVPLENVKNINPSPNFGGRLPFPHPRNCADLAKEIRKSNAHFGAAFDADGDRHLIMGKNGFCVNSSDTLAVLGANLHRIPLFEKRNIKGYARTVTASTAIDRVAVRQNQPCYEVPTGWIYLSNLMEVKAISLCGDDKFGVGAEHIREKDGIWTVLAWMTIISLSEKSLEQIVRDHWKTYGRDYFTRHEYADCNSEKIDAMLAALEPYLINDNMVGTLCEFEGTVYKIALADYFQYKDPRSKVVARDQAVRIIFDDGSRIVMRRKITGDTSRIRLYFNGYEPDLSKHELDIQVMLRPLISIADALIRISLYSGRSKPTSIL